MKKLIKLILLFIASVFIFTIVADAQTQTASVKEKKPKVVKAVPQVVPAAAKAVRREGEDIVEVEVNSEGKVISAKAISAHPLTKKASVEAAKNWEFDSISDQQAIRKAKLTFVYQIGNSDTAEIKIDKKHYKVTVRPALGRIDY